MGRYTFQTVVPRSLPSQYPVRVWKGLIRTASGIQRVRETFRHDNWMLYAIRIDPEREEGKVERVLLLMWSAGRSILAHPVRRN